MHTSISFEEWTRANNIFCRLERLDPCIYGFVYKSSFGNYFIIINKNLTKEMQKEVFAHELIHIIHDLPEQGYIIGVDMQYSIVEKEADDFAKNILKAVKNF